MSNFKNVKSSSGSVLNGLNFDKQPKSIASQFKSEVFTHRINESNRAMKAMIQTTKSNMRNQPVLDFRNSQSKQKKFPSLAEMMGAKK